MFEDYDYRDTGPTENDALLFAVPLEEEQGNDSEDLAARCGFGCTTGVDSVMHHDGMLAIGLAMQEEFNEY